MDEGVVERRVDVCDAKDQLALRDLGAEGNGLLLGRLRLLGGLDVIRWSVRASNHSTTSQRKQVILEWETCQAQAYVPSCEGTRMS